jgi:cytochrome c biogenesis protein CcmG, thiol:disulfide interchange protein DsbE
MIKEPLRNRRVRMFIGGLLFLVLGLSGWIDRSEAALRIGDLLPSFAFASINGDSVKVPDDFKGKVIVFHFWTIGCSSCRKEMPALDGLYRLYRGKGLEILAVNVGQRRDSVKIYAAGLKVSYPMLIDPDLKSTGPFNITDVPRTYLIDRKGVVRYRILGAARTEVLKKLILSIL